jgi:ribosomal protein S18 acetylase RimI-like enzyme
MMIETMPVARLAHQNVVEAFASLPRHQARGFVRRAGGVVVAATGSPIPLFNAVIPAADTVARPALAAAVQEVRDAGLAPCVQLREDVDIALAPTLLELGLREDTDASWPAMVLETLPTRLEVPAGFEVRRVVDDRGFEDHIGASGGDPRVTATWLGAGLVTDPRWTLYVGYADGAPVARSMGFVHDGMVGVYNVGVREAARRRGYGWAMTMAALVTGAEAGCTVATLQSSAMGLRLYASHGFREIYRYRAFRS